MKNPRLHLIWAQSNNGIIGRGNALPWHVPEDLQHFKKETHNKVVIMGRQTWWSLPEKVRPLPGRLNVVLTSDAQTISAVKTSGAIAVANLDEALRVLNQHRVEDAWVIGGSRVFEAALPHASTLVQTVFPWSLKGDVMAPILDENTWSCSGHEVVSSKDQLVMTVVRWERRKS